MCTPAYSALLPMPQIVIKFSILNEEPPREEYSALR